METIIANIFPDLLTLQNLAHCGLQISYDYDRTIIISFLHPRQALMMAVFFTLNSG